MISNMESQLNSREPATGCTKYWKKCRMCARTPDFRRW